eukprot:gene12987-biopygen16988
MLFLGTTFLPRHTKNAVMCCCSGRGWAFLALAADINEPQVGGKRHRALGMTLREKSHGGVEAPANSVHQWEASGAPQRGGSEGRQSQLKWNGGVIPLDSTSMTKSLLCWLYSF